MAEVGDKFVIKIAATCGTGQDKICFISDTCLAISEKEIEKLEKYEENPHELPENTEIRVGDEVIDRANTLGLVDRFIVTGKMKLGK